jgi:hypothetical protein
VKAPGQTKGRPRKRQPKSGERVSLGLRVTPSMKATLDAKAKAGGRSQSQEAELRIEQTFAEEKSLIEALNFNYGPELAFVMQTIGEAMKLAGADAAFYARAYSKDARGWWDNPYAFTQAMQAAHTVLTAMKPDGDSTPPRVTPLQTIGDDIPPEYDLDPTTNIGRRAAASILEEAATGHTRITNSVDRARRLHRAAGPFAERIKDFAEPEFRDADAHIGDDR